MSSSASSSSSNSTSNSSSSGSNADDEVIDLSEETDTEEKEEEKTEEDVPRYVPGSPVYELLEDPYGELPIDYQVFRCSVGGLLLRLEKPDYTKREKRYSFTERKFVTTLSVLKFKTQCVNLNDLQANRHQSEFDTGDVRAFLDTIDPHHFRVVYSWETHLLHSRLLRLPRPYGLDDSVPDRPTPLSKFLMLDDTTSSRVLSRDGEERARLTRIDDMTQASLWMQGIHSRESDEEDSKVTMLQITNITKYMSDETDDETKPIDILESTDIDPTQTWLDCMTTQSQDPDRYFVIANAAWRIIGVVQTAALLYQTIIKCGLQMTKWNAMIAQDERVRENLIDSRFRLMLFVRFAQLYLGEFMSTRNMHERGILVFRSPIYGPVDNGVETGVYEWFLQRNWARIVATIAFFRANRKSGLKTSILALLPSISRFISIVYERAEPKFADPQFQHASQTYIDKFLLTVFFRSHLPSSY